MTFTPDRKRHKSRKRASRANPGPRASGPGDVTTPGPGHTGNPEPDALQQPASPSDTNADASPSSLSEQLKEAGFDLAGHQLADYFDTLDPVCVDDDPADDDVCPGAEPAAETQAEPDAETVDEPSAPATEPATSPEPTVSFDAGEPPPPAEADISIEADEPDQAADTDDPVSASASPHPLLTAETWNDLVRFAPEVTASLTALMGLDDELRTFDRPMGPTQAMHLIDGAEALSRITEALQTLALSVYERIGTPTDSGAKTTQTLIQNRLNITAPEARRRVRMAKNLGGRVNLEGQALPPRCPIIADKLHDGTLSSGQAAVIETCLDQLPDWVDPTIRQKAETELVSYAPTVSVADLREIFRHMLAHIDPDGNEPTDPTDRSMYYLNARPKRNGDWRIEGLLDPTAGSELHGLLTSRIQSADELTPPQAADTTATDPHAAISSTDTNSAGDEPAAFTPNAGLTPTPGQEPLDLFDAVLSGDRYDAPPWAVVDATTNHATNGQATNASAGEATTGQAGEATTIPAGHGVRADGSMVNLIDEQPSARNWIYERFATLISRISMKEAEKGSPYALVVTAKADDLATNTGEGTTGAGDRIPIEELTTRGLGGTVFFHLMDETARTVEVRTENRFANKKQIAIITARDRGCTFPGCDAPPGWCDANHVVPYSAGGKTDINNMCLACSWHHHLLDRSEWTVRMTHDGRPAWVPPASLDPAQRPIYHSRFIADDIIDRLFDE